MEESKRKRLIWSLREELIQKSRESALAAIKVFNDPLIYFKSETFIVLMIIAWTYLMHAYYRLKKIDYRYYKIISGRKRYDRTKYGAYKYWELERCLNDDKSPIDKDTTNNLRFLIGLRHEIEHQMTSALDGYLSGRYQACVLNYNYYLKKLFGEKYALDQYLTYSLQFVEVSKEQLPVSISEMGIPSRLKSYITAFDSSLSNKEYNDPKYSFRLVFTKKLANRLGQADKVVEFVDPNSAIAESIEKEYWVKKEVEKPKFRAKDVVIAVRSAGFPKFRIHPDHVNMWRSEDAKNPSKGYGVCIRGYWYWYENWVKKCIELCEQDKEKYT